MFYLVTVKCGHVGRGRYVEKNIPLYSNTKKDASKIALDHSKVKRHLKNAVSFVQEISYIDYIEKKKEYDEDSYFRAHSKQELSFINLSIQHLSKRKRYKSEYEFKSRAERINYKLKKMRIEEQNDYEYVY
ncbi:MAG: hypothetical protein K2M08_07695 [Anaeroplasmataceae bacterium]|nr:hypothetical protein [Anaeroplasmataceae bacterium]